MVKYKPRGGVDGGHVDYGLVRSVSNSNVRKAQERRSNVENGNGSLKWSADEGKESPQGCESKIYVQMLRM